MNVNDIATMDAGLKLDVLIAKHVMGFEIVTTMEECSQFAPGAVWIPGNEYFAIEVFQAISKGDPNYKDGSINLDECSNDYDSYPLCIYSGLIEDAWGVVDEMHRKGWLSAHKMQLNDNNQVIWLWKFIKSAPPLLVIPALASTIELAVCRSALMAMSAVGAIKNA